MPGINLQYGDIPVATRTAITTTSAPNNVVDTAQYVFGNASLRSPADSGYVDCVNAGGVLNFGTSDFTIELRYRPVARSQTFPSILSNFRQQSFAANAISIGDRFNDVPTKFCFDVFNFGSSPRFLISTTNVVNDTWYAIAITRSGNTFRLFIDGVLEATNTNSGSVDGNQNRNITLGRSDSTTVGSCNGYIDEFRVSNIARYTATYTPATQPFVNDANTLVLLHCDGTNGSTSFPDDNLGITQGGLTLQYGDVQTATRTAITTASVNNAQVSTAQFVFGNASGLFSSAQSAVSATNAGSALTFGTGDFTFEMRYRPISKATNFPTIIFVPWTGNYVANAYTLMDRHDAANTKFTFWVANYSLGGPMLTSTTNVSNNTWYAIAITRSGNTFRMFVDGVLEATQTFSGSLDSSPGALGFGWAGTASNNYINGYIDELRVSNIARYTATYTPATQAFVNDANTRLLLHMDGANGSTSFPDDNLGTSAGGLTITY
jgi:hypothetical protein